ncbi:hypothetical protein [Mesorhizobium sp. M0047]
MTDKTDKLADIQGKSLILLLVLLVADKLTDKTFKHLRPRLPTS